MSPLVAEIVVPAEGALVRGEIPVFGRAMGANFAGYRLEYGEGNNPDEWFPIADSREPAQQPLSSIALARSTADQSVDGNLGTWDTGLTNYVYLPTYPPNHPINLKGTYTLRLVVVGEGGTSVEDRATIGVGNVIPNAWGGDVTSPDGVLRLRVPEHALRDSFRVVLVDRAVEQPTRVIGRGRRPAGRVYRVRPAGERFSRESRLEMRFSPSDVLAGSEHKLGVYGYDESRGWEYLPSRRDAAGFVTTDVRELHSFYTLMASDSPDEGSEREEPVPPTDVLVPASHDPSEHFLLRNDFEHTQGEWTGTSGSAGAAVTRVRGMGPDGSTALRISSAAGSRSAHVNVHTTAFDARDFPIVEFSYRVPETVKTDFIVRVAGRWYSAGFTDDRNHFDGSRVNMASIGEIPGVVPDDRWHTVRFDLYEMLRSQTANSLVEKIVLADWDVRGYMKLLPGRNSESAEYWVDDFSISRGASSLVPPQEDFQVSVSPASVVGKPFFDSRGLGKLLVLTSSTEGALSLDYDVTAPGSFVVYPIAIPNADLRGFELLSFRVHSGSRTGLPVVGMVDGRGQEHKLMLSSSWLHRTGEDSWDAAIPIRAFGPTIDLSQVTGMTLGFEAGTHTSGDLSIADVRFRRTLRDVQIETFEQERPENLLGQRHEVYSIGDAAISGRFLGDASTGIYRLSYGGRIGHPSALEAGLSFVGWMTELAGIDCSTCDVLRIRLHGALGGERPNIYLDDGTARWGVDLEKYGQLAATWTEFAIPLEDFAAHGVDLTHLVRLDIVIEWEEMNGALYVDEIAFGPRPPIWEPASGDRFAFHAFTNAP